VLFEKNRLDKKEKLIAKYEPSKQALRYFAPCQEDVCGKHQYDAHSRVDICRFYCSFSAHNSKHLAVKTVSSIKDFQLQAPSSV
jgi:hypothetical protein